MKKLFVFALGLLALAACQEKQYFKESPEIDLVKKGIAAYFSGDWDTFRAGYADTAKIAVNVWDEDKWVGPDAYIEGLKSNLTNYAEYNIGENPVYEMIVTDEGDKWVHAWFLHSGKTNGGKDVTTPVNVSFFVKDNKIAMQIDIFNALPGYLARQPADSMEPADSTMVSE
jgi:hypothetical protein